MGGANALQSLWCRRNRKTPRSLPWCGLAISRIIWLGCAPVRRRLQLEAPSRLHPEIIRYFGHSGSCAVGTAGGGAAEGGDVLLLDMGAPIRIKDLAEQMVRLSSLSKRILTIPMVRSRSCTGLRLARNCSKNC